MNSHLSRGLFYSYVPLFAELRAESNAGASLPTAAFSETLIRKIGYDPREGMDGQGRRHVAAVRGKLPHERPKASPVKEKDTRSPVKESPVKRVQDEKPVLARGESPAKKIMLSDFDDDD